MMDDREKVTKHEFIDKCVAYKTLLRVIDAQEKFSYLKRELGLFFIFMLVFFLYVGLSRHIAATFHMQRAVMSNLAEKKFPASPEPSELDFITFHGINDKVRPPRARPRLDCPAHCVFRSPTGWFA